MTNRRSSYATCCLVLGAALASGCSSARTEDASQEREPVTLQTANRLLGRATASSVESAAFPASNAVDGNLTTRWSSQWSDPQWIQIDFGSVRVIHEVTLFWQHAYGAVFQIQVSADARTWTTIENVTNGTGGTDDFPGLAATGRYIRMYGTKRGTGYGYSLYEFAVYGGAPADAGSDADAHADARADAASDAESGAPHACKRGLAYGYDSVADLTALANGGKGVSWWYNWSLVPDQGVGSAYTGIGVDFVPMQWGGSFTVSSELSKIPGTASWLLGFNEPEDYHQAGLAPQQAAALWPQLEQIAHSHNPPLKLVSPAVNYCGGSCNETNPFTWLDQFFAACTGCQVDALAVHWYSCNAGDLKNYIRGSATSPGMVKYGKPIWLTEFANLGTGCPTTAADTASYMAAALPYLESEPAIARYAWFTGRSTSFPWLNLLGASGQLTPLGEQYVTAPQGCE